MKNQTLWTPGTGYDTVSYGSFATMPKRGMETVNLRELGILPGVVGGAPRQGTHVAADIVTQTADGRDLNDVWRDFIALLNSVNAQRQGIINFLTFPVSNPLEMVPQAGDGVDFEESSEFGEPVGARVAPTYFNMAYGFKWYDLAARYTWQYLADATQQMVDSVANAAVEAYWRRQLLDLFRTVFNPANLQATINQQPYNVYKFYNNDGTVPPKYKNNAFDGTHTHYRTSGAATLTAPNLDSILDDFASHGYGLEGGYRTVIMVNTSEANVVRNFRNFTSAAQAYGGNYGRFDFIAAQGQPGQLLDVTQQLIGGSRAPASLNGLTVIGTYGPAIIVQEDWMPVKYVFAFVTGGSESLSNPVGLREHANAGLRGLRLVKGRNADYPLIDSFWAAGFGFGIRHRGAGMLMQVTANPAYATPAEYV